MGILTEKMVCYLLRNLGYNLQKIGYLIKTHYKSNRIGKDQDGSFLTRKWSITDSNDVKKSIVLLFLPFLGWQIGNTFFSHLCLQCPADAEGVSLFPLEVAPTLVAAGRGWMQG